MTKKIVKQHRFFFVRPCEMADADEFAERVANLDSVDEVFMTEGEYGFLVKAKLSDWEDQKELAKQISEASSGECKIAVSHYKYMK